MRTSDKEFVLLSTWEIARACKADPSVVISILTDYNIEPIAVCEDTNILSNKLNSLSIGLYSKKALLFVQSKVEDIRTASYFDIKTLCELLNLDDNSVNAYKQDLGFKKITSMGFCLSSVQVELLMLYPHLRGKKTNIKKLAEYMKKFNKNVYNKGLPT